MRGCCLATFLAFSIALTVLCQPQSGDRGLNVALHAQSRYESHGWVAGSEVRCFHIASLCTPFLPSNDCPCLISSSQITTSGLLAALRRHPAVHRAEVFAPFAYEGMLTSDVSWDVLVIEGWTGPVPKVIAALRAASRRIVVLHWCLDTYPDLDTIAGLDVDGFITNSRSLVATLGLLVPTLYLPLAADPAVMLPVQSRAEYQHPVVYLGQASHTKHRLIDMLSEVAPLGLAIYGLGWDRFEGDADPRFSALLAHWRGVLPKDDIAALYSSAAVVVGTTEEEQRQLGMVNNRLFEALACGAAFVSDHFPALESTFGDTIFYSKEAGDTAAHVSALLANRTVRGAAAAGGRRHILNGQTYDHRVAELIPWIRNTFGESRHFPLGDKENLATSEMNIDGVGESFAGPRLRPNRPSITLVYDAAFPPFATSLARGFDLSLVFGLLPALSSLEADDLFRLTIQPINMTDVSASAALRAAMVTSDLLLIRASWDSELRRVTSMLAADNPPFKSLDGNSHAKSSRGDRWQKRAALGILLAPQTPCMKRPGLPSHELRAFDLVVHDSPLGCSVKERLAVHHSFAEYSTITATCAHSNTLHGLSTDVAALRDDSEGWNDGDFIGESTDPNFEGTSGHWEHLIVGGLGGMMGPRVIARLCDPMLLNSSRAILVPPSPPYFVDENEAENERAAQRTAAALRDCGVEVRMYKGLCIKSPSPNGFFHSFSQFLPIVLLRVLLNCLGRRTLPTGAARSAPATSTRVVTGKGNPYC